MMSMSHLPSPWAIAWAIGFLVHVALVLYSNTRAGDEWPPSIVLVCALWPICWGLLVVALLICSVGLLAELLSDPRNPQ